MSEQAAVAAPRPRRATRTTRRTRKVVANNPNATLALGSGSGLGTLVIWLIGINGAEVPPEASAALAGLIASAFLFIGRRGLKGAILGIWDPKH